MNNIADKERLSWLILSDPPLASEFVQHLAKVYRYVLEHRKTPFIESYRGGDTGKLTLKLRSIKTNGLVISKESG